MYAEVQEYYGKVLNDTDDLKTNACCPAKTLPDYMKKAMENIHSEVLERYYGCGLIAPQALEGVRILDLGSGSGCDCYVLSQLVGEAGLVVGVDMTDEQLEVANRHIEYHRDKFGYAKSNIHFYKGYIERLDELDLAENFFDVIVSNCVVNLSPDKEAVFRNAYRLLKPGGEMYFSDVYADRRVPENLAKDPVIYGECLGGALYWNDFINLAKENGFKDPRLFEDRPITIENQAIQEKTGHIRFYSATYRLFKIDDLEPACEDYGQAVMYKGTVQYHPDRFVLDKHHTMDKGKVFPVCGNTYRMLHETRFKDHFEFLGDWKNHYGIFENCGSVIPFEKPQNLAKGGCC